MIDKIDGFKDEYDWLSNFALVDITYKGYKFPSTENAYQACKGVDAHHLVKCQLCAPNISKRLGKTCELRENWLDIRPGIMYDLNMLKYTNDYFALLLVHTGDAEIIEGNWWHDNYWGDCKCSRCAGIKGENNLGKIIMKIRDIIGSGGRE